MFCRQWPSLVSWRSTTQRGLTCSSCCRQPNLIKPEKYRMPWCLQNDTRMIFSIRIRIIHKWMMRITIKNKTIMARTGCQKRSIRGTSSPLATRRTRLAFRLWCFQRGAVRGKNTFDHDNVNDHHRGVAIGWCLSRCLWRGKSAKTWKEWLFMDRTSQHSLHRQVFLFLRSWWWLQSPVLWG